MKKMWKLINGLNVNKDSKNRMFICGQMILNAIAGALIWCAAGRFVLPGSDWLLCFIGIPAVFFGFFGSAFYLYGNEFV